ncbi:LysR family transcriptional regulator [Geminicoccaceae bacterium 1502E]|nr:LysR family transcriptional regulator [Geminicoccaceae bacterium 1502E]
MRWRFEDVTAFVEVVETGSITTAARRLNLSKSVVSKRVADLEAALGTTLFRRTTRSVVPTDHGLLLHERMRGLLRQLDQTVDELAEDTGRLRGRLRVAAPMSFGSLHLAPVLIAFAARHPEIELALDFDDRMVDLQREGYDLAVRIGRLPPSSLIARRLCTSRRVVCCSPAYAARHGLPESVEALAGHCCIEYAHAPGSRLWQFEPDAPGGEPRSVIVRGRISVNNGETMCAAVEAGLGLAVLPLFIAADGLRRGSLVPVLEEIPPLADAVHAVWPPSRHLPPRVRALIAHLQQGFAGEPPWERDLAGSTPRPARA